MSKDHSAATSLFSKPQIAVGEHIPDVVIKEHNPGEADVKITSHEKIIILGVPAAFSTPCNSQIPGYLTNFDKFKAKGVSEIYVVAVNDVFVTEAWKKNLEGSSPTPIRFLADDLGGFTSSAGLLFDASAFLGGPRSKRYAIIAEGGKVKEVFVEENPPDVIKTKAETILEKL